MVSEIRQEPGISDLNVFRIFQAAADASSFAGAAEALGLSRSAVAKAVARLEEQTDTRLFNRTTRIVTLTDEGRALHLRCAQVISELDEAVQDLASRRSEPRGVLRLTVPDGYGRIRILPALATFLERWPNVTAEVNFSDRPVDVIAEGYDLALRLGAGNASDDLIAKVIARHRVSICGSPAYFERCGEPRTIEDLARHSCLQFVHRGHVLGWRVADAAKVEIRMTLTGRASFDSGEALRDAACRGLGLCQLPDFLIDGAIADGRLRRVMVDAEPSPLPVVGLYPSRKYLTPKVRRFIEMLAQSLASETA